MLALLVTRCVWAICVGQPTLNLRFPTFFERTSVPNMASSLCTSGGCCKESSSHFYRKNGQRLQAILEQGLSRNSESRHLAMPLRNEAGCKGETKRGRATRMFRTAARKIQREACGSTTWRHGR